MYKIIIALTIIGKNENKKTHKNVKMSTLWNII